MFSQILRLLALEQTLNSRRSPLQTEVFLSLLALEWPTLTIELRQPLKVKNIFLIKKLN